MRIVAILVVSIHCNSAIVRLLSSSVRWDADTTIVQFTIYDQRELDVEYTVGLFVL